MALTAEVIKANEQLATLSDEQLSAIATLSLNDESAVLGARIGEIHGRYEADIKEIAGVDKNQGEKAYDYMKRVLGDYKGKVSTSSEAINELNTAKQRLTELEEQVKSGKGNEAMAQRLKDEESRYNQLKSAYDADKSKWDEDKKGYEGKITKIHVDSQFASATASLKFKQGYPEGVQKTLLESAKSAVLGNYTPDWIESDSGRKMVFRDKSGEIVRNKANALNPYTASELISEHLKEVLDSGRKVEGAGTTPPNKVTTVGIVDIAGASTQVQADEVIVKYLLQTGETRGSASFAQKQNALREENGVNKLPIR
ncbi:MAG: hypothetical protein ACRCZY_05975 [Phocaeicola sp.]